MSTIAANDLRGQDRPATREIPLTEPQVSLEPTPFGYPTFKSAFDFLAAMLLLVATAPVILLAMALVKLSSRGPVLYTQTRVGRNGKPFMIFKLRTMAHKCENATGVRWATPDDPRITSMGRILRRMHIDELPQLWNVLKGEMSLIGPRPERPEFLPQLEHAIPRYRGRLLVKPGMTGLAQVQLPADSTLASVRLKLVYDLYYVRHRCIWLDIRIFLCTVGKMMTIPFPVLCTLFWLPKQALVEKEYKQRPKK